MALEILKNFFETRDDVMEDLKKTGFWPTTLVSGPSPALPPHWHDCDIHGYLIEGRTWILDGASGERLDIEPGDKLVLPAGTIHAEGETTEKVVYIVALSEPRPFLDALRMHPPDEAGRPS